MKLLGSLFSWLIWAAIGCYVGFFGGGFYYTPPKSSADLAAWAGAIGTIAAFVGTVVLATRQSREKQRTERNLAALVAAGVLPGISEAIHTLQWVEAELSTPPIGHAPSLYLNYSSRLKLLCPWDAQLIQPLAILANDVGYHLEFARSRIVFAQTITEQWASTGALVEGAVLDHIVRSLQSARRSLEIARNECKQITPPVPILVSV
ncbi:hypothetical protein [Massilia sp. BJB1822]|uniref:hypothetical protein n=1 Tax=Massilia sp. BJB1822 TaxID=2744470 RepID=UPI001593C7E5|nr:hypothetical protein [Massilia sp. BJB1822]NVE01248.1 hypothetical protein [Massilia sp. BJB1822]